VSKRIVLKKDWDILPSLFRNKDKLELRGYFVGREKELEFLINDILHKNSGAILVCGHRGVGKTALVYKALSEAMGKNNKIIPVIMNAAQLEAEGDKESINPRNIIENLVRRLYTAVGTLIESKENGDKKKLEEIFKEIEKLYKKAVAKEFKLTETLTDKHRKLEEEEEEEIKEFLFDEKSIKYMIFLTSWAIGLPLMLLSDSIIWRLFGALFALPIPFSISFAWRKHRKRERAKEESIETKELYQYDDRISNIEFDLERIHQHLSETESRWKLVYIIDELDKLEPKQVSESLKYFKHLFTQSDALFIFIGGEELYNLGSKTNNQDGNSQGQDQDKDRNSKDRDSKEIYRPKEYTYFTTKYYLSRPLYNDLSKFIDEIIERTENLEKEEIEIFKRAVCFDAWNDFFDLRREIRNRISSFENGKPVIEISETEFSRKYLQKARMHKAITILFEDRYMSTEYSKWSENEELMRAIFQKAHEIINSFGGVVFGDPAGEQLTDDLIRDFHHLLNRCGALADLNQTTKKPIRGQEVAIKKYSYIGQIPTDPPDKFEDYTEYDKRFVKSLEEWADYLLALVNPFKAAEGEREITREEFFENPDEILKLLQRWGYNAVQNFKNFLEIKPVKSIVKFRREDIEKHTEQITNYINGLKNASSKIIMNVVPNAILGLFSHLNLQRKPIQNPSQEPKLFSSSAEMIRNKLFRYQPIVVHMPDFIQQIMFIHNNMVF